MDEDEEYFAGCGCEIDEDDECGNCGECEMCCECCPECGDSWCSPCPECDEAGCECECCSSCGYSKYDCICCAYCGNSCTCCCDCICNECGSYDDWDGEHCANCGYDADPDLEYHAGTSKPDPYSEKGMARRLGLNPDHNLRQLVADYYLLQYMWQVRKMGKAWGRLVGMAETLAPEFATYLDMAVGGELRYRKEYNAEDLVPPVSDVSSDKRGLAWGTWITWLTPLERAEHAVENFLYGWVKLTTDNMDEMRAVYEQYGWCSPDEDSEQYFDIENRQYISDPRVNSRWNGGYGGPPWSQIAATLVLYLKQEIGHVEFLDRVWNLQHNGGVALNKVYKVSGLRDVLNTHANKEPKDLLGWASSDIKELFTECEAWSSGAYRKGMPTEDLDRQHRLQIEWLQATGLSMMLKQSGAPSMHAFGQKAAAMEDKERFMLLSRADESPKDERPKLIYSAHILGRGDYTPSIREASQRDWVAPEHRPIPDCLTPRPSEPYEYNPSQETLDYINGKGGEDEQEEPKAGQEEQSDSGVHVA